MIDRTSVPHAWQCLCRCSDPNEIETQTFVHDDPGYALVQHGAVNKTPLFITVVRVKIRDSGGEKRSDDVCRRRYMLVMKIDGRKLSGVKVLLSEQSSLRLLSRQIVVVGIVTDQMNWHTLAVHAWHHLTTVSSQRILTMNFASRIGRTGMTRV